MANCHSSNKTVLVTGAGRRLGALIARDLAEHGWNVAVHYRHSVQGAQETVAACREYGMQSEVFFANFEDEASTRALVPAVVAHFGQLSAIVNSASLFEFDDVKSFSYAAVQQHLLSNTAAPIVLAQVLAAHLEQAAHAGAEDESSGVHAVHPSQSAGVVVNMLDQKLWNQNPDFLSYTLSKAALEAAGTMMALALAPAVRVVGVAPGLTLTSNYLSQEAFEAHHKLSPLGRSSSPEDVVKTVRFALENQSITGTTLLVDGGQHLMRFERDFSKMV